MLDSIAIDHDSKIQLNRQIYEEIRKMIVSGQLQSNAKLPSTRDLASELCVSRTTIRCAFDQLLGEGYLNSQLGSGTFVAQHQFSIGEGASSSPSENEASEHAETDLLSNRGARISQAPAIAGFGFARPFVSSVPGLDQFPFKKWYRILSRQWRYANADNMSYGDLGGFEPLRRAIATYLTTSRGVNCNWEQVIVVAGAQQGYNLIANMLLDVGDPVWVEDPGYTGALGAFIAAGAKLTHVPVDESGLVVEIGRKLEPKARLALVTPSRQYPLGMVMPFSRRTELLDWAASSKTWIVEDDYDSEFRYSGAPLPALHALDKNERTIYVGSFSKVLFPALRLGYLVVPPKMASAFTVASGIASKGPPTHLQAAVAEFIEGGHFSQHIRRMRKIYKERQDVLVTAVRDELSDMIDIVPSKSGLHLIGWLKLKIDAKVVCDLAETRGIFLTPLSDYYSQPFRQNGIMMGFASSPPEQLRESVKVLAEILNSATEQLGSSAEQDRRNPA